MLLILWLVDRDDVFRKPQWEASEDPQFPSLPNHAATSIWLPSLMQFAGKNSAIELRSSALPKLPILEGTQKS